LHWLSLKESQTKNFKIVCDCGSVFIPKRIKNIHINFCETVSNKTESREDEPQKINFDLIKNCVKILVGYGFTDQESEDILIKCHKENLKLGSAELIKFALQSIGG
jgi:Holliday junction resolvasome RuvABC DNA-binding subunit